MRADTSTLCWMRITCHFMLCTLTHLHLTYMCFLFNMLSLSVSHCDVATVKCPSLSQQLVTVNLTRHFIELDRYHVPKTTLRAISNSRRMGRCPANFVRFDRYLATSDLWGVHQLGVAD